MRAFAELIAAAMTAEWGETPSARKEVGRITSTDERAVRNWFEGKNCPSAENLVVLIQHSDAVLETVLQLSGRKTLLPATRLLMIRDKLRGVLEAIDDLHPS